MKRRPRFFFYIAAAFLFVIVCVYDNFVRDPLKPSMSDPSSVYPQLQKLLKSDSVHSIPNRTLLGDCNISFGHGDLLIAKPRHEDRPNVLHTGEIAFVVDPAYRLITNPKQVAVIFRLVHARNGGSAVFLQETQIWRDMGIHYVRSTLEMLFNRSDDLLGLEAREYQAWPIAIFGPLGPFRQVQSIKCGDLAHDATEESKRD